MMRSGACQKCGFGEPMNPGRVWTSLKNGPGRFYLRPVLASAGPPGCWKGDSSEMQIQPEYLC